MRMGVGTESELGLKLKACASIERAGMVPSLKSMYERDSGIG